MIIILRAQRYYFILNYKTSYPEKSPFLPYLTKKESPDDEMEEGSLSIAMLTLLTLLTSSRLLTQPCIKKGGIAVALLTLLYGS